MGSCTAITKKGVRCRLPATRDTTYCHIHAKGLPSALDRQLELEYAEINNNFRFLADLRFKLLAFVPTLGGVAVFLLSNIGSSAISQDDTGLQDTAVLLLSILGFVVTLGIVFYDQRNSQHYNALIHRAKFLEKHFRLPRSPRIWTPAKLGGQFQERPRPRRRLLDWKFLEMSHDRGLALIYGPVIGAWLFPGSIVILRYLGLCPEMATTKAALLAVSAGILCSLELLRQDRLDHDLWTNAPED